MSVVALLVLSVMVMSVVPVLAARTPKDGQIFVKVLDASGKGIGKTAVIVYQPNVGSPTARTVVGYTKGNGLVVFNLNRGDTYAGVFVQGPVEVSVYKEGVGYIVFPGYALDAGPSGSIVIETTW